MRIVLIIEAMICMAGAAMACSPSAYAQTVYEDGNNIYFTDASGREVQLTSRGKDSEPQLSPDGRQVIFVRAVKECPYNSEGGWIASGFDEIWSVDSMGDNQRCIVKNNYSQHMDMNSYRGSFDSLRFSPDGKYIYFLCQNSISNAILYRAARDGSASKKLCPVHELYGAIGGNPKGTYYGHLVVLMKKGAEGKPYRWATVVMDPDGREVKEIEDPDEFWATHETI